jgi:lipopolysaccharide/colanic/teichoic acid biosynthesis glycosyltransferase
LIKRPFDIICSSLGLVVLAPFLILAAILIKIDSKGPMFYRGFRVGKDGKDFRIFKFRTMVVDAEKLGGSSTADDDPRITRVGLFIRKYKIDELPQLINVLRGEMSLVGPRPNVRSDIEKLPVEMSGILTLRPGITDWASLWNTDEGAVLEGFEDPDNAYEELILPTKSMLQLRYLNDQSFMTDIRIIWCTIFKLFSKEWMPTELSDLPDLMKMRVDYSSVQEIPPIQNVTETS